MSEGELVEMAKHFKETIEKKNELILQLQKNMMMIYGLIRATDENFHDENLIGLIRGYCSDFVEEFLEK